MIQKGRKAEIGKTQGVRGEYKQGRARVVARVAFMLRRQSGKISAHVRAGGI